MISYFRPGDGIDGTHPQIDRWILDRSAGAHRDYRRNHEFVFHRSPPRLVHTARQQLESRRFANDSNLTLICDSWPSVNLFRDERRQFRSVFVSSGTPSRRQEYAEAAEIARKKRGSISANRPDGKFVRNEMRNRSTQRATERQSYCSNQRPDRDTSLQSRCSR